MSAIGLYAAGVIVLVFGILGFVRGWFREVVVLAGLVVGWALVLLGGKLLVALVDRAYLAAAYVARGGLDAADPGALLRQLRAHPLVDPARPDALYAVVFAVVLVVAYAVGTRRTPGPDGVVSQMLGVPVGLMNGYLLAWALFTYAAPAIVGPGLAPTTDLLGRYSTPVLAVGATVVAGFALAYLKGRSPGARVGRSVRARSRG